MPASIVKPGDEATWEKAKEAVHSQYPELKEDNDRFWALTTAVYKKMSHIEKSHGSPRLVLLLKSYVQAHTRRLPSGRTVTIAPYFNKRIPKTKEGARERKRKPSEHPVPSGVYGPLHPEQLTARLVRHVREGKLTHAEAHANLDHLERRAQAGHHLEHGHGPSWTPEETHGFIAHARGRLKEHAEEQERAKQEEEKQRVAQEEKETKTLDAIDRDLSIEERKTASTERDTERTLATEGDEDNEEETVKDAVLITGQTYPVRRELRNLGAVWHDEEKGYLIHPGKHETIGAAKILAERYKGQHKLNFGTVDVPASTFEGLKGEDLRAYRQRKLDRKITLWRQQADRLDQQAEAVNDRLKPYDDYAFWTEPIKIGHHSEGRHRRLRERLSALMDKRMEMQSQARQLRERADRLERTGAQVKGDTARARQQQREQADQNVSVGSRIRSAIYGTGTVTKVNKNTYTVRFDAGHTSTTDKSHVTFLGETVDTETLKQQAKPKFKKGQRVRYDYIGRVREGVISGVGPQRYTIQGDVGKVAIDHARVLGLVDDEKTT